MTEYITSVIAACAIVALGGFISYSDEGGTSRAMRSALSLLLLYTVASPVVSVVSNLGDVTLDSIVEYEPPVDTSDPEYYRVAEQAFCEGIQKMVCEQYAISAEDIEVCAFDFDFKSMSARKIKIILSGDAVYADSRGISATVSDAGLGECEVELELA